MIDAYLKALRSFNTACTLDDKKRTERRVEAEFFVLPGPQQAEALKEAKRLGLL